MKFLANTITRLELGRERVLAELHPKLLARVVPLLSDLDHRLVPICGYRDEVAQGEALRAGTSSARWGESPHNYRPALAVDLVLHPAVVAVRAHPDDPRYPDLWDDETPEALVAWQMLDVAARARGLERVRLRSGALDRPHVQLPDWRSEIVR